MTKESSQGFLTGIFERLRGVEQPKTPSSYILPNSPHFRQYYTQAFFQALDRPNGVDLERYFPEYLERVQNPKVEVRQSTDHIATVPTRGKEIYISTSGAATIVRDHLFISDLERLRRTVLVSGIDQLLAAYYAKDMFSAIEIDGQKFPRDGQLETIKDQLRSLKEGDNFRLFATGRKAQVTVLPFPEDAEFLKPEFFLIGPQEFKFENVQALTDQASRFSKRVLVEAKRNQLELGLAYLSKFEPTRVIIAGATPAGYLVLGKNQEVFYAKDLPPIGRGNLEFLIHAREGNVDGFVRSIRNNLSGEKNVAEVIGIDVVQRGVSIKQSRLKKIEAVLPIPVYPVQIRVI